MMEQELRALIGTATTAPVDWGARPQGAPYPGVVLNSMSRVPGQAYTGPDGVSSSRIQIDVYAKTYGEAKMIARAIEAAIDGHRNGAILRISLENETDMRDPGDEANRPFRVKQDFRVHWRT